MSQPKHTILVYRKGDKSADAASVKEALSDWSPEYIALADWQDDRDHHGAIVLTWLNDADFKDFMTRIVGKALLVAILPHPDCVQSRIGFGVHRSLQEALAHLHSSPEPVKVDAMYCNGSLVFNHVVIGDTFQLVTSRLTDRRRWWTRFRLLGRKFWNLRPFRVKIATENNEIQAVVSGIVLVQHGKGSLLSRLILQNSFANDGRLHAFLISPRSLVQLLLFALRSVFSLRRLPPFAAHIKTGELRIASEQGFDFSADGVSQSSTEVHVRIEPRQFTMIPGHFLAITGEQGGEAKEIFKVAALPGKEASAALEGKKLPFITHASTEEFEQLFVHLRSNAQLKGTYLTLMVLSTLLATFGIFANSTPVVIGAMILAPLMSPIISLSMGALRQDRKLILQSLRTIGAGLVAGFLCAVVITWLTPLSNPNAEILTRIRPNLLDLGIAVVSGIAGAFAHAREEVAKTLAGVAIAVALVPPLAVSGIGLAWLDSDIFLGALLLLLTNLAGMVLAGVLTFLLMGYSPFHLARRGLLISLFIVFLLSLPLAFSFKQMLDEHKAIERVERIDFDPYEIREVRIIRRSPLVIGLTVRAGHSLAASELDHIKARVEEVLQREVQLEIQVAIQR